ncbi:resistin-like [Perognathus longimembris pacificus]|uniref:resistin-like n=1 Tax=Perognathus longimembris pacificus TaxID=214514 RepID=UPI00201981E6|nr:resistin-like [Perognathus longimembris pacificus]XP_048196834.1 resistin-like [Perognathus longimembris pacificus]
MKALSLLLFLLSVLGLLVFSNSLCPVEEAINQKMKNEVTSLILEALEGVELDCKTITSRGDLASCPEGHTVTACTCGSACGSWDVRAGNTCHCQCAGMDWTGARCCRLGHKP